MIQIIYRWEVLPENQENFLNAWGETTQFIRDTTVGARGSFFIVNIDRPTEILTIAKWDELHQWHSFVKTAKSTTMKKMHLLGKQLSHEAYREMGNFTV